MSTSYCSKTCGIYTRNKIHTNEKQRTLISYNAHEQNSKLERRQLMSKDSIKVIKKTLIWILKWALFTAVEFLLLYVAIISWNHDFAQFMDEYSDAIIPFMAATGAMAATMIRDEGTILEVKD